MEKLILIPAKKNSKGIKNKNLIKINGKSLVERVLIESFSSKLTNLIYVSSDSKNILNIAEKYGAISIKRPNKFCTDKSIANSVVGHFISVLPKKIVKKNPWIIYLQPTSPLRKSKHLIEACKLLIKKKPVVSVYRTQINLFKGLFEKKNLIYPLVNDNFLTENRQNLPKTFYPNGAIYIFKLKDFIRRKRQIPISGSIPYIMSIKDSLDIDNIFDLKILKKIERNEKF
jgi:hypothetical protein